MQAAGLAIAALVANGIAAIFTIVFARALGAEGYRSLAALVSAFLILAVAGSAVQVAVARDTVLGRLGAGPALAATIARWSREVVALGLVLGVAAALLAEPLADLIGVDERGAAALVVPTAALWLLLSLQRGALQGLRAYVPVGTSLVLEAFLRLVFGAALVALGADVTGAFVGVPLAMLTTALVLQMVLRRRTGSPEGPPVITLRQLLGDATIPIAALTLFAILQNIDVIVVNREIGGDLASSYAVDSVAAKVVVWTAVGLALYLLPEATRRAADGFDARPLLMRSIGLIAVVALPMIAIFALASRDLLEIAFGEELTLASGALPWLGAAMSLLALTYLGVQFLLALSGRGFLIVLAIGALAEPALIVAAGDDTTMVALVVAALQLCVAVAIGLITRLAARPSPQNSPS